MKKTLILLVLVMFLGTFFSLPMALAVSEDQLPEYNEPEVADEDYEWEMYEEEYEDSEDKVKEEEVIAEL